MNKNVGTTDRIVRLIAALAVAAFILEGTLTGLPAAAAGVVAAVLLLTGSVGMCPAYRVLKFSTRRKPPSE